ncbi:MAG TPA: hypothetical protein VMV08_04745 [Gaiellaceae bacterium]|nr:hypothetical protein [Gaiellaceae bacterium]
MLAIKITSWSGFSEPPTVVIPAANDPQAPQAGTRPALRLIRGGKS